MANILDIFRTNTGEALLEKSKKITDLNLEELKCAFTFTFPALLSACMNKKDYHTPEAGDLVQFIEEGDLIKSGKNSINSILSEQGQNTILHYSAVLKIEKDALEKILYISNSIINLIIAEIFNKNRKANFAEIVKSLSGLEATYDKDFIQVLIKNPDDPNLIDNSENIALGKNRDDDDQSILGGYAGGR